MKHGIEPPRPSRQTNQKLREETVSRMLDSSIRQVGQKGATGLLLADVAHDAGYSHTLPNYYFKSKSSLLKQTYAKAVDAFKASLAASFQAQPGSRRRPGLEVLLTSVHAYLASVSADAVSARAMHVLFADTLLASTELLDEVRVTNHEALEFFESQIRLGIAAGEVDSQTDAKMLALIVLASLRGIVSRYLADPGNVDLEQASLALQRLLRRGVQPDAAAGQGSVLG